MSCPWNAVIVIRDQRVLQHINLCRANDESSPWRNSCETCNHCIQQVVPSGSLVGAQAVPRLQQALITVEALACMHITQTLRSFQHILNSGSSDNTCYVDGHMLQYV
eukprot:15792-Heterococcus_DN1.PRE.2